MPLLDSIRSLFRAKPGKAVMTVDQTAAMIERAMQMASSNGGWFPIIREPFTGAWQRNLELNPVLVSSFYANFACKTLIARDFSKLRLKLVQEDKDGIWNEVKNPAYSPLLRKQNRYQTRNQFFERWMLSKLSKGNTYALKVRDNRFVVTGLHVLNPDCVIVLVSDDGSVFYQLRTNNIHGLPNEVTVPATEIIHDRMNCDVSGHPLIGVPPIVAAGLAALQGINIQTQSAKLYANNAQPGGVLSGPNHIADDTAARLKAHWEDKFGGDNVGRVAVLGDGLKFEKMSFNAEEGQLIEQLGMAAEIVCSCYHVPPFKIGVGDMPSYDNVQALQQVYYESCLQSLIEDAETCLDEGLGLTDRDDLGVEFEIENLMRMDPAALTEATAALVQGSIMKVDEARKRFNLKPIPGGNTVYMQQQNYSLEALAKRDAQEDPFATSKPPAPPSDEPPPDDEGEQDDPDAAEGDDPEMESESTRAGAAWALRKALATAQGVAR